MRRINILTAPLLLAGLATPLTAQDSAGSPSAQGTVAVTIYNNDQALVTDERTLQLGAGRARVEFPDVSAHIRPETVTLAGPGIGIVEQNFDYDLLSPDKLMEKAVGQVVTIVRTNPATGAETREQARVLAANQGIVLQIGNRIEVLRDDGLPVRVVFDKVPPNLRARPTLSVTLESARAGAVPTRLAYLTTGLGWSADYVALFDEARQTIDVQGWVTLRNNSGTTYTNADTLLVAGQVGGQRRDNPGRYGGYAPISMAASTAAIEEPGTESGTRERLGDYYLYPLAERTTIANAQQKQVSFLDVKGASAKATYQFTNGWLASSDAPQSATSVLKFGTGKSGGQNGGLGDQLPAGTMRVYMRDKRGDPQFIGENALPHTPMGSSMAVATGQAFDVKVRAVVEQRTRLSPSRWQTKMRYTLTNARPQPVTVDVAQDGLWGDVRVAEQSLEGKRISADRMEWSVPVPANGTATITVTFDSRN